MQKMVWRQEYNVGIREIDGPHRALVDDLNRLLEHTSPEVHAEMVSEVVGNVVSFVGKHIREEEAMLKRMGYPGLDALRREHLEFAARIADIAKALMQKKDGAHDALVKALQEMWVEHIQEEVSELKVYFKTQGAV